jgi:Ca2+-binding EF-hand superfamily protein
MKVTSWEALMDAIDVNGDGKISLEELERQVFNFTDFILLNPLVKILV